MKTHGMIPMCICPHINMALRMTNKANIAIIK